jgi:hypothetical protein
VPFFYQGSVAEARVRTKTGTWLPLRIEASDEFIRIEYPSSRSPTGRVAVVGEAEREAAVWFPVGGKGERATATPVAKKTTWSQALTAIGLPSTLLARYAADWAPTHKVGPYVCRGANGDWAYDGTWDKSVCVEVLKNSDKIHSGLPLYASDQQGMRVFEVTRIAHQTVPKSRFQPPDPKILHAARTGCGA